MSKRNGRAKFSAKIRGDLSHHTRVRHQNGPADLRPWAHGRVGHCRQRDTVGCSLLFEVLDGLAEPACPGSRLGRPLHRATVERLVAVVDVVLSKSGDGRSGVAWASLDQRRRCVCSAASCGRGQTGSGRQPGCARWQTERAAAKFQGRRCCAIPRRKVGEARPIAAIRQLRKYIVPHRKRVLVHIVAAGRPAFAVDEELGKVPRHVRPSVGGGGGRRFEVLPDSGHVDPRSAAVDVALLEPQASGQMG